MNWYKELHEDVQMVLLLTIIINILMGIGFFWVWLALKVF